MPDDSLDKLPVKLSLPLEYQQDLFNELRSEDELVILARGLGLLRIVINLLHSYDAAGNNLIVVVAADERENGWIGEALAEHAAISMSPKARGLGLVNTDLTSVGTREKMYARGGIFSITSQILIVDLLSNLLNPETITGLVVLHAERVIATSLEAFILRIYRQKNKVGFLKAFCDNPEPFTSGFSPLSTMMRNLFLRKPSLWPRFHVTVAKSLEGRKKAEVIELEVPMTDNMTDIQNAVLECVEVSIGELKKANTGLEMDDWNVESALFKSFDVIIRRQLDPVWHRLSWRTKQIVNDLTVLRGILHSLLTYDAVSFNRYLDTILAAHSPPPGSTRQSQSPWLFLDAAHVIFDTAKRRVYTGKDDEKTAGANPTHLPEALRPVLEEQPKWSLLAEVLEEIERDVYFNPTTREDSDGTILIMCSDQATCRQLREYLQTMYIRPDVPQEELDQDEDDYDQYKEPKPSAGFMMRRKLRNYLNWKRDFAKVSASLFAENQKALQNATTTTASHPNSTTNTSKSSSYRGRAPPNKRRRLRGGLSSSSSAASRLANGAIALPSDVPSHLSHLLSTLAPTEHEADAPSELPQPMWPHLDSPTSLTLLEPSSLVIIHPYSGDLDEHLLEESKPRYVIMYEPDAAFIRRIEVYRSSHDARAIKVYFLYYGHSVEEQRYLSAVRREKDAYTRLIREKSNMAVTLTLDGQHPGSTAANAQEAFLRTVNTRIAGGGRLTATAAPPSVVVDVREFRSSLPSLLHAQNLLLIPCLLTVGDYILSPDICVERKSVRDLIASLNSGRLHHQATTMLAHYKYPMLLIEFEDGKSFTLEPFADLNHPSAFTSRSAENPSDLQSRLVLLSLAFPRLKIIWSSSPYQTALIFQELKKGGEEPDPMRAVTLGLEPGAAEDGGAGDIDGGGAGGIYSGLPREMLRVVPGVTEKVAQRIVMEVGSLWELVAEWNEDDLAELVGREIARQIGRFLRRDLFEEG